MGPASNFSASLPCLTNPHGRERHSKSKEGEDELCCSVLEYQAEEDGCAGPPLRANSLHSVRTRAVWLVTQEQAPLQRMETYGIPWSYHVYPTMHQKFALKGRLAVGGWVENTH